MLGRARRGETGEQREQKLNSEGRDVYLIINNFLELQWFCPS